MRPSASKLLLWSLAGVVISAVTFVVMVQFRNGQRVDFSAFEGRKWMSLVFRRYAASAVRHLTPLVVMGTVVASIVVAQTRRGVVAAVSVGLCVPSTVILGWTLKAALPRHELVPGSWINAENTYPSGHMATVTVAMLAAVSVSPPRWRSSVTALAIGAVTAQTLAVAASGWHRPSDLMGGLGIAVGVSAITSIPVVSRWEGDPVQPSPGWCSTVTGVLVGLSVVLYVSLAWLVVGRLVGRRSYGSFVAHAMVLMSITAAGYVIAIVHSRIVDAVDGASRDRAGQASGAPSL